MAISSDLLDAVDDVVREGKVDSRNEFLETALRNELSALRRADIDAVFQQMADDRTYQREAAGIAEELESASWEAWRSVEGDS
ncbi:MAG TPA: hypothetical protein VGB06_07755 [Solirubrobacterales bacterium]